MGAAAVLTWMCAPGVASCPAAATRPVACLNRSDVVFPYTAPAEIYRHYGATTVAWGFRPWKLTGDKLTAEWRLQREVAHGVGARYQARVELDAGWKGWIEFEPDIEDSVCKTLEGKLLTYKVWTKTHRGKPAYQGCTNAKAYRRYLVHQAREALSSEPDMLLIDAIQVTPMTLYRGGCFCESCVEAFREYLRAKVPAETLAALGIGDVATFDYGAFLRGRGVTDEQFGKEVTRWPATLPLAQEYLTFQHLAARAFIDDFRKQVEAIAGRRIPLSTSSPLRRPRDWWAFPVVDHFTIEAMFHAKERSIPWETVFRYRLADALGTRVLATGVPQWDFTFVRDNQLPGLVRTWIAQAYAHGHQFMVPYSMWCGEDEKSRYESKPGDCDDLYRFVREHAALFNGYEAVADVGVLYDNTAFRRGQRQAQAEEACYDLAKKNIPFCLVVAGDEWMPVALREEDLASLRALVITKPIAVDPRQQAVLKTAMARNVEWPNEKRLWELVPRQIAVTGAENVTVLPRVRPDEPGSPVVCHLLNRNYLPQSDSMRPMENFCVTLDDSLVGPRVAVATLLAPACEPIACDLVRNGNGVTIRIPRLDLWAVLRMDVRPEKPNPGDDPS